MECGRYRSARDRVESPEPGLQAGEDLERIARQRGADAIAMFLISVVRDEPARTKRQAPSRAARSNRARAR